MMRVISDSFIKTARTNLKREAQAASESALYPFAPGESVLVVKVSAGSVTPGRFGQAP
jgi:hypothetical protein